MCTLGWPPNMSISWWGPWWLATVPLGHPWPGSLAPIGPTSLMHSWLLLGVPPQWHGHAQPCNNQLHGHHSHAPQTVPWPWQATPPNSSMALAGHAPKYFHGHCAAMPQQLHGQPCTHWQTPHPFHKTKHTETTKFEMFWCWSPTQARIQSIAAIFV